MLINSLFFSQANSTVRFYHRKHQCYIVGEGSFVGRYGDLPETNDVNDDSVAASFEISTMSRRKSNVLSSTSSQMQYDVKADIERIPEEVVIAPSAVPSPFSFDLESQEQSISFSLDGSISQSDTRSKLHTLSKSSKKRSKQLDSWESSVDDVVSEDGKNCIIYKHHTTVLHLKIMVISTSAVIEGSFSPREAWQAHNPKSTCSSGWQWSCYKIMHTHA